MNEMWNGKYEEKRKLKGKCVKFFVNWLKLMKIWVKNRRFLFQI